MKHYCYRKAFLNAKQEFHRLKAILHRQIGQRVVLEGHRIAVCLLSVVTSWVPCTSGPQIPMRFLATLEEVVAMLCHLECYNSSESNKCLLTES